ncbi:MAG: MFS transporter, partial [Chloroflexi bacterium]|nr:MFS transporter [Chloroflexota bacterium]
IAGVVSVLIGRYSSGGDEGWLFAACGLLALVLLVAGLVTARTAAQASMTAVVYERDDEASAKTHPDFKWLLVALFFVAIGATSLTTFLLFYLRDVVGLANPASHVWQVIAAAGLAGLVVAYPAGNLTDRIGRKPVMVLAGCIGATGTLLLLAASSLIGVIAIGALVGAAIGMFSSAYGAMANEMVSVRRPAQQLALLNVVAAVGAGVARLNGMWVDALNGQHGGSRPGRSPPPNWPRKSREAPSHVRRASRSRRRCAHEGRGAGHARQANIPPYRAERARSRHHLDGEAAIVGPRALDQGSDRGDRQAEEQTGGFARSGPYRACEQADVRVQGRGTRSHLRRPDSASRDPGLHCR